MERSLLILYICISALISIHCKTLEDLSTTKTSSENLSTSASYQVTENVIDVPDDRPSLGPIVPNYTIGQPLNFGNETELKGNKISLLHIKAEYEDQNCQNYTLFRGIKDYFQGIKNKVVKTVNNWLQGAEDSVRF